MTKAYIDCHKNTIKRAPVVSLSKKLYSHCLALVGSRNGFERKYTICIVLILKPGETVKTKETKKKEFRWVSFLITISLPYVDPSTNTTHGVLLMLTDI